MRGLAAEVGIENPTDEELRRFDKTCNNKNISNDDWELPNDPGSRISQIKDGTTHPAYKAEHVVDLDTDLVLAAEIYTADRADSETLAESVGQSQLSRWNGCEFSNKSIFSCFHEQKCVRFCGTNASLYIGGK